MPDTQVKQAAERGVIFVASLPPPLHGQSNVNQSVRNAISGMVDVTTIDASPGSLQRSSVYVLRRGLAMMRGALKFTFKAKRNSLLYVSVDSGLGLLYNVLIVMGGRFKGLPIVLHHHSFSYITRTSRLMEALVRIGGRRSTHVFLCERMQRAFRERYPGTYRTLICSNAALISDAHAKRVLSRNRPDAGEVFRIGLISNLCREKGLYDFLDLVRELRRRNLRVQGFLAGPVTSGVDKEAIERAIAEAPEQLRYLGPLYGDRKADFFDGIDAFIFPTRYKIEAYPLVLLEALGHGLPIISFDRGCIPSFLSPPAGHVIPQDADFVGQSCEVIEGWCEQPSSYNDACRAAQILMQELFAEGQADLSRLVELLACSGTAGAVNRRRASGLVSHTDV